MSCVLTVRLCGSGAVFISGGPTSIANGTGPAPLASPPFCAPESPSLVYCFLFSVFLSDSVFLYFFFSPSYRLPRAVALCVSSQLSPQIHAYLLFSSAPQVCCASVSLCTAMPGSPLPLCLFGYLSSCNSDEMQDLP